MVKTMMKNGLMMSVAVTALAFLAVLGLTLTATPANSAPCSEVADIVQQSNQPTNDSCNEPGSDEDVYYYPDEDVYYPDEESTFTCENTPENTATLTPEEALQCLNGIDYVGMYGPDSPGYGIVY